ncbi:nuclease harbi1 [Lasius niger]|uniref:Nuclease harbi1 n=1 Tax=Lasius niger TaxID=67767 RepID=A0A0J7JTH9_LASNI|nr:nuclease harbi1 [Lasius niger]
MPEPSMEMWIEITDQFYLKTDFPNCVGAVDGKHIRCINPRKGGSNFFNYKKFYSIILMAVANANHSFVAIDVGAYGKGGDSVVFRNSPLGKKLYLDCLNLPPPRCLPKNPQPFVIVGDEAFKLSTNLLRPYPARELNATKL